MPRTTVCVTCHLKDRLEFDRNAVESEPGRGRLGTWNESPSRSESLLTSTTNIRASDRS